MKVTKAKTGRKLIDIQITLTYRSLLNIDIDSNIFYAFSGLRSFGDVHWPVDWGSGSSGWRLGQCFRVALISPGTSSTNQDSFISTFLRPPAKRHVSQPIARSVICPLHVLIILSTVDL